MKLIAMIFVCYSGILLQEDAWNIFARVKFEPKFSKAHNEYFMFPQFEKDIQALEGTEISLRGHYIPFDLVTRNAVVISKNPYAACFFCGGAGPESVVEVVFKVKKAKFKMDQVVTVKGKLKLNDSDVDRLTFILDEATVIEN
jgi:hypothetical protein